MNQKICESDSLCGVCLDDVQWEVKALAFEECKNVRIVQVREPTQT